METLRMFLNGGGMSGGNLHDTGVLDGSKFLGPAETAPRYRFWSVRDEFPGLQPVDFGGVAVPGELYELTYPMLRGLLLIEPAELELSAIEMSDGSGSLAMVMRAHALSAPGVTDISEAGGWRAYVAGKGERTT